MFKKYMTMFLMLALLAIMIPAMSSTALGDTRRYRHRHTSSSTYKRPNFYRRHRKAVNIGAGTGAGLLVGGLLGGRKGAVIGGLTGAGGGYLITKKQRSKNYVRRYRTRNYRNY